jgi:hypothetical protein
MHYSKPFTLNQRQKAISVYRAMRVTLGNMRFEFPPVTVQQKALLRRYRDVVGEFAHILTDPDVKVDVERLNDAEERSIRIALDYAALQLKGGPDG